MSDNRAERRRMSSTMLARSLLQELVGYADSKKHAIAKASRKTGWSWNRCKEILNADPRIRVSADEIRQLEGKRHDPLLARIEAIEAALIQADEDFYRPHLDALRGAISRMGGED